ncbi:cell division protein FtsQ/DivIB [Rothia sp. P13129]|uniref:cell division protein FtsQ/DivIB n=1 Tax=Rothia sp. P13129 TaxID=3402664 RepID=UPI003AC57D1D
MSEDREQLSTLKDGQPSNDAPVVRINSSKVKPVEDDSLVSANSRRFAQWRSNRAAAKGSSTGQQSSSAVHTAASSSSSSGVWSFSRESVKRWIYTFLGLLVIAAIFVGVVFYSPLLAIKTITVQGASLLSSSSVEEKLRGLEGVPLTRVSDQEVSDLIGHQQILRGVSISARAPHELIVTLHERIPVAAIRDGSEFVLVDSDGVMLSRVDSLEASGVPLIAGGGAIVNTPQFKTVTRVLESLPRDLLSMVTEAKADSTSTITLMMGDDRQVLWGTTADSDLKAKVLIELMKALGEDQQIKVFDVSSPLVPTTR